MPVMNLGNVFKGINEAKAKLAARFQRGLQAGALYLINKSQEIVPIDQKDMHDSGTAYQVPGTHGFTTQVIIGYGGTIKTSKYTVFVHEDLQNAHGFHYNTKYAAEIAAGSLTRQGTVYHSRRPQEKAKFLEEPYYKELKNIMTIIITEIRR